jgi:hypothetical protein
VCGRLDCALLGIAGLGKVGIENAKVGCHDILNLCKRKERRQDLETTNTGIIWEVIHYFYWM